LAASKGARTKTYLNQVKRISVIILMSSATTGPPISPTLNINGGMAVSAMDSEIAAVRRTARASLYDKNRLRLIMFASDA